MTLKDLLNRVNEEDIDKMDMGKLIPAIQKGRLILLIRDITKKGEEIPEELQEASYLAESASIFNFSSISIITPTI